MDIGAIYLHTRTVGTTQGTPARTPPFSILLFRSPTLISFRYFAAATQEDVSTSVCSDLPVGPQDAGEICIYIYIYI